MHPRLTLTSLCLLLLSTLVPASPTPPIAAVEIHGNRVTLPQTMQHFFAFEIGEPLDTAKLRQTRANLLATGLFSKVDVFPHIREDGAHVFVILRESVRVRFKYGADRHGVRYGRDELWFNLRFDMGLENFRGRMEELDFGAEAWDRRSLDLLWHKPLLSTPYFIALGGGAAEYPDYILPIDYSDIYAQAAAGRTLGKYSRVSVTATPVWRRRNIVEDALDSAILIPEPFKYKINEMFLSLNYSIDRRSARFDPRSGWYYAAQLRTNRLQNGGLAPFFQLTNEMRAYWSPGGGDVAAVRTLLTLRDRDADSYHRLAYGGPGEIRGYSEDQLGWQFAANSSFLASLKYHKQLYKTQRMPFPLVNTFFVGAGDISFRVDATFLVDYALLSRGHLGVLTLTGQRQDGMGVGFGTRIMVPEVRQSGCMEVVFGRQDGEEESRWAPSLHVYMDMFF